MKNELYSAILVLIFLAVAAGCADNLPGEREESPTSGHLDVFYDEGLHPHVVNQVYTFEALYPEVFLKTHISTEQEAVRALYADSCEAIMLQRLLGDEEQRVFASKGFKPRYSHVAYTGVALIVNRKSAVNYLTVKEVKQLLKDGLAQDTTGTAQKVTLAFDRNNSSAMRYMLDSVLVQKEPPAHWSAMNSTKECIGIVRKQDNVIGVIDFAWLSDSDDPLYKDVMDSIRTIAVGRTDTLFEYPHQSSFKTGGYPLTRRVYVIRKTGEYTIAKGFESFVAGPKGQLTFLKQGLMPARQAERRIEINLER